jgi:hypothetical protein
MTLNGHLQNARFCEDRKFNMITFDFFQIVHKATDIRLVTNVSLQVQPTVTLWISSNFDSGYACNPLFSGW